MEDDDIQSGMSEKEVNGMPESAEKRLQALRERIDDIDARFVYLLAERQAVVEDVVSLKKAYHLPVHHPAREENMISERRRQGAAAGVNPDYLEELFRCVMRHSRIKQGAAAAVKAIRPDAKVLIVGGTRGMGAYFYEWFNNAGYQVRRMGGSEWPDIEALTKGIDLAIVSVPIDVTVQVIRRLAPHLPRNCLLVDLTSIKVPPMEAMLASHAGPVIGLHPMFGPTTSSLDKQIIVMTLGREHEQCQWLIDQFAVWGAVVVRAEAREHDDIMGIVQGLRHFATFTIGQFMCRRKIDLNRTLDFSSPIYRLELGMVGRLFAQDPSLYAEIIFASPKRLQLLKEYLDCMNDNLEMIEKGDMDLFKEQFHHIAEWFGPFSDQALRESSFLIDKLIERF